ncbi:hypothetical protein IWX62_003171 [Arthrobacter sp. CAN_A1]
MDFLVGQMVDEEVHRPVNFSEDAIWCDGKTVAVVANDQL